VIGVAGSVAVGKSTTARVLQQLLAHWPAHPSVALVTTDGFLYPNAELERRGLLGRKGFPESYDRKALLRFVIDLKSGKDEVTAPSYSHLVYDVVPGQPVVVKRPDIVVVEGLNVLQPARVGPDGRTGLAVSDFFDFSVYVDAATADIRRWYTDRFLRLRHTAFRDPTSYFTKYADLTEDEAVMEAGRIWDAINGPNLTRNIAPTRGRATLVLRKAADHSVSWVRLRKL
jgi:type I pantothenate kinase